MSCRTLGDNGFSQQMMPRKNNQSLFDWLYQNFRSIQGNPVNAQDLVGPSGPPGPAGPAGPAGSGGNDTERGQVFTLPTVGPEVTGQLIFKQPFKTHPALVLSAESTMDASITSLSKTGATYKVTGIPVPYIHTFETKENQPQFTDTLLIIIDGKPAVSHYNKTTGALKLFLAFDALGTTWNEGQTLVTVNRSNLTLPHSLCVMQSGVIGLTYYDSSTKSIMYLQSNDSTGINWPSVSDAKLIEQTSNDQSMQRITLGDINGIPGVAWTVKEFGIGRLMFATQVDSSWQSWLCGTNDSGNSLGLVLTSPIHVGAINGSTFIATSLNRGGPPLLALVVQDKNVLSTWTVVPSPFRSEWTRMIKTSTTEYTVYRMDNNYVPTIESTIITWSEANSWSFGALVRVFQGNSGLMTKLSMDGASFLHMNGFGAIFGPVPTTSDGSAELAYLYFKPKPIPISYAAFG